MIQGAHSAEHQGPLLEARRITKHFGGLAALTAVDLQVRPGDLHAIIGPNGAGKTTFFNVITGLLSPDEGEVFFRGERVTGLPAHAIARLGVARTLQVTSIFPGLSVEENLWVGVNAAADGGSPGTGSAGFWNGWGSALCGKPPPPTCRTEIRDCWRLDWP